MTVPPLASAALGALLVLALAGGCRKPSDNPDGIPTPEATAPGAAAGQSARAADADGGEARPTTLDDANLARYARALRKQAEIIRRPGRGTHYGVTVSKYDDVNGESSEVLEAAGMTVEEYRAVDQLVDPVLTTLNFQGRIGPPRSMDLDAAPEWRARLEGDAFATLPPESAEALRRNLDTLAPLWSDIVGLTAQHGR